eukprot:556451-Pyramimonas_sp.AAC.1
MTGLGAVERSADPRDVGRAELENAGGSRSVSWWPKARVHAPCVKGPSATPRSPTCRRTSARPPRGRPQPRD